METKREKFGFTLVELLTVMAVIAILIGLLVPALNLVRKMAKDTSQKAQFHSIGVSLDIFSGENDGYPESSVLPNYTTASNLTVGAQRLAEALVGRDMLGYDPQSSWDAYVDETDKTIYASQTIKNSTPAEETASLVRRKGPYLSSENIEAYEMGQLYTDATAKTGAVYDGSIATGGSGVPAPVLTDGYRTKSIVINNKRAMAGSPILYYKANASLTGTSIFPSTQITPKATSVTELQAEGYIYNSNDNEALINLGLMKDQANVTTNPHHFDDAYTDPSTGNKGRWFFYDTITNPKITSQPRPYNASSYLLISAGYDGIYGTTDDITNFGN
ncbi:MAG: type II secretion system protein [Phycisphaerae bacterium]